MDIVLTTNTYKLAFDSQYMYVINMGLYERCSIVSDRGKEVKITKGQVKSIIDFIIQRGDLFCNNFSMQQELADALKGVHAHMTPSEKMEVKWW